MNADQDTKTVLPIRVRTFLEEPTGQNGHRGTKAVSCHVCMVRPILFDRWMKTGICGLEGGVEI